MTSFSTTLQCINQNYTNDKNVENPMNINIKEVTPSSNIINTELNSLWQEFYMPAYFLSYDYIFKSNLSSL